MAELNVISPAEAGRRGREARPAVTPTRNGCVSSAAPFFCDYAVQYLMADPSLGKTATSVAACSTAAG